MLTINQLIQQGHEKNASDIHLVTGLPPKFRIDGELVNADDTVLTHDDCEVYAKELAGDVYNSIKNIGELDLASTIAGLRIRINLFKEQGNISAALRILHDNIPVLDDLDLPPIIHDFATWKKGIVLVTGETGSGKSTTLAAILDQINHTRTEHIITLEDPIEYIYTPDKCVINQREIGTDTVSYTDGLRAVLREDPDIILIGEMRDQASIEIALTAAETGHLVFATLHTNSAVDAIDRMVGVFPAEKHGQIRLQLSTTLKAVVSQQLLVRAGGHGRIAACEVMIVTAAIKNLIREGKTPQMVSSMLAGASEGSVTMDNALIRLWKEHKISAATAQEASTDKDYVRKQTY